MLSSKLKHFVNKDILLSVYYGIFHSHLVYLCLDWGQAKFSLNRFTLQQKRDIRILHTFCYLQDHTSPLFHRDKGLKFVDIVSLENCIFVNKWFNNEAFSLLSNHFELTASSHSYCTRLVMVWYLRDFTIYYFTIAIYLLLMVPQIYYQLKSLGIIFKQSSMVTTYLKYVTKKIKSLISKYFFENHEEQPLYFYYYS